MSWLTSFPQINDGTLRDLTDIDAAPLIPAAVEAALDKHICRCTGYVRYYNAVRDVILKTPGLTTGKRSKEVVNNG